MLLLQTPTAKENSILGKSRPPLACAMMSGLQEIFLDFLYPVQTLALIRRLKNSVTAHQHAVHKAKQRSRTYTSIATALISGEQELSSGPQKGLCSQDASACRSAEQLRTKMTELLQQREVKTSRNALWQVYQDLLESSESLSPQEVVKMLRCLAASKFVIDNERLLALFESMPVGERRAIHYRYAISAALKLNDTDTAFYAHREALSRLHSLVGASAILHHAAMHKDWRLAIKLWHPLWELGLFYYTRSDIWAGVETMPLDSLLEVASSSADFASLLSQSNGSVDASSARNFSLELSKRVFRIQNVKFNIDSWRLLLFKLKDFASYREKSCPTGVNALALEQALSLSLQSYSSSAIEFYYSTRLQGNEPNYRKAIYETLLQRCLFPQHLSVAWEIIEDCRKQYGQLELSAYKNFMLRLARAGQANSLQDAFELYRIDHGLPQDPDIYRTLLSVHFRRADPEKAAQGLLKLEQEYGFSPTLSCYNTVIHTFARVGDVEGAVSWFEALQNAGLSPDNSSYFPLILVHSKRGDKEAVHDLLQQVRSQGLKPSLSLIDLEILTYTNDDNLVEAEILLEEALSMELEGERTRMWNVVINAYAMRKDLPKVKQLHKRMQDAGIPQDSMTFAALISGLSRAKFPLAAYKVLQKVMPALGIEPTVLHYALIMRGFLETESYDHLFNIYKTMLERGMSPTVSTQNTLLRAAAAVDERSHCEEGRTTRYNRARQILEQTVADLDPSELTDLEPRQYIGPHRLDEAFTSTYYEYMIFLYGASGAFAQVSAAYDEYIQTAQNFSSRDVESSPPMRMLSALLVAHKRAGNMEEVDRCWYLALDKCDILARRASAKAQSRPGWVLPGRRYLINLPFGHYATHLGQQSRFGDLVNVVDDLHHAGYELDHHSWNVYIQCLCRSSYVDHQMLAFLLCETHLIPHWGGWESMGRPSRMKKRFKGMIKERIKVTSGVAPTYLTFVWLTKAYVDLGFGKVKAKGQGTQEMLESGRIARTLDAVRNMPMWDDWEQRTILGRGPYSDQ